MFLQQRGALAERRRIVVEARPHRGGQFLLVTAHFAGDPLETGERVDDLYAVALSDGVLQRGRDESLHESGRLRAFLGNPAELLVLVDPVVGEQRTHLVAGQRLHLAGLVAHGDAHAIGIGIGGHHHVEFLRLGQRHAQRERLGVFRIGRFHRGETCVESRLRRHFLHLHPRLPQCRHGGNATDAMDVGVDHLEF